MQINKIKKTLEGGNNIERQEPFIQRTFDPYMDGKWIGEAISYGCYREGQAPGVKGPSEKEILEDLNIISKNWNLIRVYGSDDDSGRVLKVIKDNKLPIKVMLGIWLENETEHPERKAENIKQILKGIQLGNEYSDIIAAINVGNETLVYWAYHRMQQQNLIKYLRVVRNNTSVPVTTADDYNFWNKPESREVADEIDFIVAHIYALWNGKTLENAIEWTEEIYFGDVKSMHPEKEIVIGETGWATTYNSLKIGPGEQGELIKGHVSIDAQVKYLNQLNKWLRANKITTFIFEAFDEPWKGNRDDSDPDPKEVEKHWGLYYENRKPKDSSYHYLNQVQ